MPRPLRRVKFAVLALAALYATYFSFYTCITHEKLKTWAYDLGTFDQGIWLAGHSVDPFVTVRGLPLLGDHVRLFAYVLAPLYWIWDDVQALLILQSVVIAAGAWFLLRIAERELPGRPWLTLAIVAGYLLNPAVQNLNLDHAHPDAFATTLLLAAIDFLRAGRLLPFSIAAALAMSCKEDVPLVFVAMGVALMLDPRRRRFGLMLATLAGIYFALCMLVILPHFNGVGFFRLGERHFFGGVGAHGSDPRWLLGKLLTPDNARYLFRIGLPDLFLFLLAPLSIVPALPSVVANMLADASYMRGVDFHYQTSVLPFLYLGTIDALSRMAALRSRFSSPTGAAGVLTALTSGLLAAAAVMAPMALLAISVATNVLWSKAPVHRAGTILEMWESLRDDSRVARIHAALATIPKDAVVCADYTLVPQLSHRRAIYMFPNPFQVSNWGINGENPHDPETVEYIAVRNVVGREQYTNLAEPIAAAQGFDRVASDRDFALFRRQRLGDRASCGDWNGDGRVTDDDVRRITDALMRAHNCPPRVCDADGDGQLRTADILRVARHASDPTVSLSCPGAASSRAASPAPKNSGAP